MQSEIFHSDSKFVNLLKDMQDMVNNLIKQFQQRNYSFDLWWRGYSSSKKQFTFKNTNVLYDIEVLATATVQQRNHVIKIEVHGGKFNVKNQFIFNGNNSVEELDDLFADICGIIVAQQYK